MATTKQYLTSLREQVGSEYKHDVITYADAGVEIWIYTKDTNLLAAAFPIKGKNSIWHYSFKNREQLDGKIKELVDNRLAWKKEVAERKAKRLAPHSLKVGDILYASWGYDQTNIDWFKVDKLIGKHKVTLVPLRSKFADETPEGYDNRVLPAEQVNRNAFIKDGSKNYIVNGNDNSVKLSSYAWASPWDGAAKYETQAGYGH
tara:strand:+ start:492 stop:1100 length:609 start_codon:yes stop_codon:yes gene_type:complete